MIAEPVTGPNAGARRQVPVRTLLAARVVQFRRYTRLRLEMGNAAQNFILAVWSGGGYATGMLVLAMLMRAGEVKADDFMYETNNGTITITRYTGSGGSVIIPAT